MMQLSSKNDDSSLCYDVTLRIKILKIDKFGDCSCDIDYKRASLACAARLADTLCPPEAPFGRLGSHWLIIREITSLNTYVFFYNIYIN